MRQGNGLVRVRMRRHVASFVQVLELKTDHVYELTPELAAQFEANEMAEPVDGAPAREERLEAAALGTPRRRG